MTIAAKRPSDEEVALARTARELLAAAEAEISAQKKAREEAERERDEYRGRAEDAERRLAALVASVASVRVEVSTSEPDVREVLRAMDDAQRAFAVLREAHADAAPVAERHDREVRSGVLRRMSYKARAEFLGVADAGQASVWASCARWLRDEADRIERGDDDKRADIDTAIADAAPVAERHDRRVRAEPSTT